MTEKTATTIVREALGAHDTGKQTAIRQVLLDCAQRLLAGEKHRAHAGGGFFSRNNGGLLKFNFQNDMPLVKLRRPRQITEPDEKPGQDAQDHNPNPLDQ